MRYIISFLLTSTAALAEVPQVVTDIPAVHSLTAAVMGDLGAPVLLLDQGASPHGFQLRPSQMHAIAGAGLVIWIGPELTPWLDKALATRPVDAATLGLLAATPTHVQAFAAAHDHDHEDAGRGDEGLDPHAWLDPGNARAWVQLIARELARQDPENTATYGANAATAVAAIDAAETQAQALLAPVQDRPFVVFHDGYGYFTTHFGLPAAAAIAMGDAALPGARHLSDLRDTMAASGALCIFPEAQHDSALVTQMAAASGLEVGPALDPAGSALPPGPGLYPELILGLAAGIASCPPQTP
ncbi:MAG: zinc ABC transporter substrate-binding protein [Paracoccaceae bacterium]